MAKTPLELASKFAQNNAYNRSRVLNFLENFGDHVTDDVYVDFAKEKGFEPKNYDKEGRGYYNEYINNEDFLKHIHEQGVLNGDWDDYEYAGIDDDYERSYGPVRDDRGYQAYLDWKKQGN